MPWTKTDDGAATHPVVLGPAVTGDPRDINELYGAAHRLTTLCAKDLTDYHVNFGMAYIVAPHDPMGMMAKLVQHNYAQVESTEPPAWRLIEHDGLFHNRTKAEIDWEKNQRNDTRDPALTAAVLFRDGDACRSCRVITNRKSRRGDRQATMWRLTSTSQTMNHVDPGEPAKSPDDLCVLCHGCNAARRDRTNADELRPILPPPTKPYYSEYTAALLREAGYNVKASGESRRPKRVPLPKKKSDPAPSGTTPETTTAQRPENASENAEQAPQAVRPDTQSDNAANPVSSAPEAPPPKPRPTNLGSPGREGKGRVGPVPGAVPPPRATPSPARKRKPRGQSHPAKENS